MFPPAFSLLRTKWCIGQTLSLSYGRFFAEFLEDLSLVRLSLLDSTTCVGLRYGTSTFNPNEVFLGSVLPSFHRPWAQVQTLLALLLPGFT